jgi:hypothetical protein
LPARDRPAEFASTAEGPGPLLALIDETAAECDALLGAAGPIEWSAVRRRSRDDGSIAAWSAAYALFHAIDHLRGHADEASLTRHVWTARR